MNTSNSNRLAFLVFGLVVVATTAANAQNLRFAPPQKQSTQHARLGIQTTFQQVGIKNGTVANFGERINNVRPGSPAARTGLEAGDIIVGYYLANNYRKIFRQSNLKNAISGSRGRLRVRVINYRNGQSVNATIHFNMVNGQEGNGQGGYGNGAGGPVVHDHRKESYVPFPTKAPPTPKYQVPPAARAGYVWIRGHYEWRKKGGTYEWIRGHWERAKAKNAVWTPGHWSKQGSCWVWTAGRWSKGPTVTVTRR